VDKLNPVVFGNACAGILLRKYYLPVELNNQTRVFDPKPIDQNGKGGFFWYLFR